MSSSAWQPRPSSHRMLGLLQQVVPQGAALERIEGNFGAESYCARLEDMGHMGAFYL